MRHPLEVHILELEMDFDDTGGFDSRSQNVLFSRSVVLCTESIQIVEETENKNKTNILYRRYKIDNKNY